MVCFRKGQKESPRLRRELLERLRSCSADQAGFFFQFAKAVIGQCKEGLKIAAATVMDLDSGIHVGFGDGKAELYAVPEDPALDIFVEPLHRQAFKATEESRLFIGVLGIISKQKLVVGLIILNPGLELPEVENADVVWCLKLLCYQPVGVVGHVFKAINGTAPDRVLLAVRAVGDVQLQLRMDNAGICMFEVKLAVLFGYLDGNFGGEKLRNLLCQFLGSLNVG